MSFQSDDIIELYNYGHITFKKMKNLKLSTDISPQNVRNDNGGLYAGGHTVLT